MGRSARVTCRYREYAALRFEAGPGSLHLIAQSGDFAFRGRSRIFESCRNAGQPPDIAQLGLQRRGRRAFPPAIITCPELPNPMSEISVRRRQFRSSSNSASSTISKVRCVCQVAKGDTPRPGPHDNPALSRWTGKSRPISEILRLTDREIYRPARRSTWDMTAWRSHRIPAESVTIFAPCTNLAAANVMSAPALPSRYRSETCRFASGRLICHGT